MQLELLDNEWALGTQAGEDFLKHDQFISQEFLDSLKADRDSRNHERYGEHNRVASVPTSVIEIWMKQGLDPFRMTPKQVVAQLQRDGLDAFITTTKGV